MHSQKTPNYCTIIQALLLSLRTFFSISSMCFGIVVWRWASRSARWSFSASQPRTAKGHAICRRELRGTYSNTMMLIGGSRPQTFGTSWCNKTLSAIPHLSQFNADSKRVCIQIQNYNSGASFFLEGQTLQSNCSGQYTRGGFRQ